ncbi:MAG: NAD(P)-dependent oxidoreductase [Roseivivax sp.]|nr:NAD(P)-dependent oxidoreductase [Roseivivax sp.]
MARALVTGATGLIGRHVVPALRAAGFEVVVLGRRSVPGATHVPTDLLDGPARDRAVAQAGASHLIHLAWNDQPQGRWSTPENLDWAAATLSLVRSFARAGGRRAVCVGSCAEYDWSSPVLHESSPLRPGTLYGKAKAACGELLTAAAPEMGLGLVWARPFFIYGPGEPPGRLLGDLAEGLRAGTRVACTDGLQERDFLHAADVAGALVHLLRSDIAGPVNVASGKAVAVRDLIATAAELLGRPDLVDLGARPRPADDPPRIEADIARLEATGFRPRFDLRSGIADSLGLRP